MLDREYCVLMARYNEWMNRRVFRLCEQLPDHVVYADQGAFFGSIHLTLNHIAYADLAFLSRVTGEPVSVPRLGEDLFGSFAALASARRNLDERLCEWARAVDPEWLAGTISYTSQVDGVRRTLAAWEFVTHLFNHQIHHRGQLTTLLCQIGVRVGPTDLPFMLDEPARQACEACPFSSA